MSISFYSVHTAIVQDQITESLRSLDGEYSFLVALVFLILSLLVFTTFLNDTALQGGLVPLVILIVFFIH